MLPLKQSAAYLNVLVKLMVKQDLTGADDESMQQAMMEGLTLTHTDFLLYMATVSGGYAYRHLMIPKLIEALKKSGPSCALSQSCVYANSLISSEIKNLDPMNKNGQHPKIESTLMSKLCPCKEFPPITADDAKTNANLTKKSNDRKQ
jgi:hypothetical protein